MDPEDYQGSCQRSNKEADPNALLQVIEILLKEIRSLRNQIKLSEYKYSGEKRNSCRSGLHGASSKTGEIKKARKTEKLESVHGASSHNQRSYADVCRKNIHVNEVKAEKAARESHRSEGCEESLDSVNRNLRECMYCGLRHVFGADKCKAFRKRCYKCNKMNHFGRVCWSSTKGYRIKEKNAEAHITKDVLSDATVEEFCKIDIQASISDGKEINAKVTESSHEKECHDKIEKDIEEVIDAETKVVEVKITKTHKPKQFEEEKLLARSKKKKNGKSKQALDREAKKPENVIDDNENDEVEAEFRRILEPMLKRWSGTYEICIEQQGLAIMKMMYAKQWSEAQQNQKEKLDAQQMESRKRKN